MKKYFWVLIIFLLFILQIIDKGYWSEVTDWKEDQATNLWLGYTQSPLNMPVGLISSKSIPNPNGMVIIGLFLSRLPTLWSMSLTIGLIQSALLLWLAWLLFKKKAEFFWFCLPALASVVLRATSVEFWNQWMLTSINLLFWGLWINYLQNPSSLKIPWFILLILIAPAIYMGGLVNAVLFLIFILVGFCMAHPKGSLKTHILSAAISLLLILLSVWLTWIPYFNATHGYDIPGSHLTLLDLQNRIFWTFKSGISFPIWNSVLWSKNMGALFYQGSSEILPVNAIRFFKLTNYILFAQSILFLTIILLNFIYFKLSPKTTRKFFIVGYEFQGFILLAGYVFIIFAYMLSPLLGGFVWANGDRMDQQIQFFPFFLFAWFTIPFVLNLPHLLKIISKGLTFVLIVGFILTSLINGSQVITSYLQYNGNVLTNSDVTLRDKMQVVDFVAKDWKLTSNDKNIPIYYDMGIGRWAWEIDFGKKLEPWYPSVFTIGRCFDFELLRVYGLNNSQEGIRLRSPDAARYIVTYAFMPEPNIPNGSVTNYLFGRLRVSIISR